MEKKHTQTELNWTEFYSFNWQWLNSVLFTVASKNKCEKCKLLSINKGSVHKFHCLNRNANIYATINNNKLYKQLNPFSWNRAHALAFQLVPGARAVFFWISAFVRTNERLRRRTAHRRDNNNLSNPIILHRIRYECCVTTCSLSHGSVCLAARNVDISWNDQAQWEIQLWVF